MKTAERIDNTITELRALIEQAVRDEQLRNQLTKLPNESALDGHIQRALDTNSAFALAFVEVDHFKRINDRFGYDRADALLVEIGRTLAELTPRFFAHQATAFHAHGDEFFVFIATTASDITAKLDVIREAVRNIQLSAGGDTTMTCTVSIGWLEGTTGTPRELKGRLEHAIGHAKRRGRNRVVKYDESMTKDPVVSVRSECTGCETAFSFDVPERNQGTEACYCPNCGTRVERPERASFASTPEDITDLPELRVPALK